MVIMSMAIATYFVASLYVYLFAAERWFCNVNTMNADSGTVER